MNNDKEVVRETISEKIVRAMDISKIKAIAFAEVGAQGRPDYITIISDMGDRLVVNEGSFGFESFGRRFNGAVEIECLEETIPFLRHFRGVSVETTVRGSFVMEGGEWIHLDAAFGNHFFIRAALLSDFGRRMAAHESKDVYCLYHSGVDEMLEMLKSRTEERRNSMIGAIVGDIAGSRFQWHKRKSKRFTFLKGKAESQHPCYFTDDTVMTLAIAAALMDWKASGGDLGAFAVRRMQEFGRRFPRAEYGGHFHHWLHDDNPQPYNSWGNGSAMRVSACGWAGRTLDEVKAMSRTVTEVTHNHPEGIKGAEATAIATFLARTGKSMDEIKEVVVRDYYPLDFTLDEIRPTYEFDVSCQGSVQQALEAFFESTSF
jgi:ADP-ribosylglycohydrolase